MRVLHIFKTYLPDNYGGIEHVIYEIALGSTKIGINTDVLTLTKKRGEPIIELDGHIVHRAHEDFNVASTGISLSIFRQFALLTKQADIVHYHFPWPMMDVLHFIMGLNKPSIVTYHSDIVKQQLLLKLYQPLRDRFLSSVDRIVVTSPNYLRSSDVLQKFHDKIDVIPIGLERSTYPEPEPLKLSSWRDKLGDEFFLFIGVLRYYKGLHILLEAARECSSLIVIVGAGPIESKLKAQARKYRLSNVVFLGRVSDEDKVALLSLCFAVVFPSHLRSEAFGISLLEGAMFGKPMISSEIGTGTTFINIEGETGLVIPPSDHQALSQAMQWLVSHPLEAKQMGKRGEKRYWQLFTADCMVKSYAKLYHALTHKV